MRRLLWLLPCVLALGCATLQGLFRDAFQTPTLRFIRADLTQASLADATLNLVFELYNPNPLALSLAEVSYDFSVEGHHVLSGSPASGLSIPAEGTTQLAFPAHVTFQELVPALESFLAKDVAHYRAAGHVGVQTPVGVVQLPLSQEGSFEVPKLPALAFGSPRIASINLISATVEIPVTVTNRNSYELPVASISGALSIGGAEVGSLSSPNLGTLTAGAQREVVVPLTIHFARAAAAAMALESGKGTVSWNGLLVSGSAQIPIQLQQRVNFQN